MKMNLLATVTGLGHSLLYVMICIFLSGWSNRLMTGEQKILMMTHILMMETPRSDFAAPACI
jgi:cytochrome b561